MAFRCFFGLLFGGSLPSGATEFLPEGDRPALPGPSEEDGEAATEEGRGRAEKKTGEAADAAEPRPTPAEPSRKAAGKAADKPDRKAADKAADKAEKHTDGALALLALLQREGRLIDFLQEDIDDYDDDDVGAAVRNIHRDLRKVLADHLDLEPVMPGEEGDDVTVPKGFDPGEIRLSGEVDGEPPFKGTLQHHGWRVVKVSLPTFSDGVDRHVLAPAEVEVEDS